MDNEQLEKRVERIETALFSVSRDEPGLFIQFDRLTQQISLFTRVVSWVGGGGLIGIGWTLFYLWRILSVLHDSFVIKAPG